MKFRSLTIQIWLIFTAVLLAVIIGITMLYHFAVVRVDEKNKLNDLTVAHEAILDNADFRVQGPLRNLQNLRESVHFRIENEKIVNIGSPMPHFLRHREDVRDYVVTLASGEMKSHQINTTFDGIHLLAVISSTENGYFISYMPYMYDDSLFNSMLIIGVIFLATGFFISRIIAGYIANPLAKLEAFTRRIAAKKWGEPINTGRRDEIGRLADSMNRMQEDLKRADDEEQTFLQSISHDLKTPVMVIMSHADAIIDGVYIDTPENTAQIIKDEAISLSEKIKHLLYFNTLSYSLDNYSESEPLYLDKIVLQTVSRMRPAKKDVFREPDLEQTEIYADREKLTAAIENILDNAIRYAVDEISVTLRDRVLEIYNSGKNIPEEHLENIFNNMYKDKTGNFGIGLAITKKIVTYYGGTVKAVNRPGGVSFILDFTNSPEFKKQ